MANKDTLYVMSFVADGVEWVKIGRSGNVQSRKAALQIGCPFEIQLVRTFHDQGCFERTVLDKLSAMAKCGKGEWFETSAEKACAVAEEVVRAGASLFEPMVMKTSYYPKDMLTRLKALAASTGCAEAELLRDALADRLAREPKA